MEFVVIGITVIAIFFFVYVLYRALNLQMHFTNYFQTSTSPFSPNLREGLSNNNDDSGNATGTTSIFKSSDGVASNSEMYASQVKGQVKRLQDKLHISNYRTQYEDMVYSLDELVGLKMVEAAANALGNGDDFVTNMDSLNKLNEAKVSLANVLKIVDKTS